MASTTLLTPASSPKPHSPAIKPKPATTSTNDLPPEQLQLQQQQQQLQRQQPLGRRHLLSLAAAATVLITPAAWLSPVALASSDEEYVKETEEVINKVRSTINMDKNDPNIAAAVAQLRETSNSWVAKYRREKALLGRPSFRDVYSALNAVSGHYISFGPTTPIPAKRKFRILEEVDTAEKALQRGR